MIQTVGFPLPPDELAELLRRKTDRRALGHLANWSLTSNMSKLPKLLKRVEEILEECNKKQCKYSPAVLHHLREAIRQAHSRNLPQIPLISTLLDEKIGSEILDVKCEYAWAEGCSVPEQEDPQLKSLVKVGKNDQSLIF